MFYVLGIIPIDSSETKNNRIKEWFILQPGYFPLL